jgi:chemotaxis protein CheZ
MIKSKLFTAEKRKLKERADDLPDYAVTPAQRPDDITNAQILNAIRDLAGFLGHELTNAPGNPPEAANDDPPEAENSDLHRVEDELRSMSLAIEETKAEIAALRPGQPQDDKLTAVTGELDAVVQATEQATNDILAAVERIDEIAQKLSLNAGDESERLMAEEIQENTTKMFEACNFQDITGQRITKIVNTFKFVEARINAMIQIWGADAIASVGPTTSENEDADAALLNGPQLGDGGINQDDIDKLFE